MCESQSFEEIFLEKLNKTNINAAKNFFNFEPILSQRTKIKFHKSSSNKKRIFVQQINKKQVSKKFTAGFYDKSALKINDQPLLIKPSIVIQSKKAPQLQLCSFLIGMNAKTQRNHNTRFRESQQRKTISQLKGCVYESMIANINKIKQVKTKDMITNIRNQNNQQLPQLQKNSLSSSFKDNTAKKQSSTEIIRQYRNKSLGSFDNSSRIPNSSVDSRRHQIIVDNCKLQFKTYQKGYISYDPQSFQFWKTNKDNLKKQNKMGNIMGMSAKYYIAVDINNLQIISSKNKQQSVEIASLTKIMTCYLCILACKKYQININTYTVRVSDIVTQILGTSAQLQPGDIITIHQLLYALMLPSGNDASLMIAESIGKIIQRFKKKPTWKTPYQTFICHMNLLAKQLQLEQMYRNSSGLSLNPNFSTPLALITLTTIALKNKIFKTIINTKEYEFDIKNERYGLVRKVVWKNTNRLLWKGWQGVKTGTTETAGHCLMALKDNYLICVLDCQTLGKRFTQCIKVYQEIQKALN